MDDIQQTSLFRHFWTSFRNESHKIFDDIFSFPQRAQTEQNISNLNSDLNDEQGVWVIFDSVHTPCLKLLKFNDCIYCIYIGYWDDILGDI